ncbi:MAG: hypothetical protein MUC49_14850 [Raineya sp.]|jgi:hypothetical protein|nr:hypothetical protein [Raineya sp.]
MKVESFLNENFTVRQVENFKKSFLRQNWHNFKKKDVEDLSIKKMQELANFFTGGDTMKLFYILNNKSVEKPKELNLKTMK